MNIMPHDAIWASGNAAPPLSRSGDDQLGDGERHPLSGFHVLLVEDEVFIAFDLRQALEAVGAEVTYARTLAQAVSALASQNFGAAILDVTLGAKETCGPVAETLRARGTPFVLHSGDLDRQGEDINLLDAPVVAKPAPPEVVINRLSRVVTDDRGPVN